MPMESTDRIVYESIPDFVTFTFRDGLFKAVEENGERCIYLEASDETVDLEGETVLQKALVEQRDYFLAKGNIDLGHYSKLPPTPDRPIPREFEIGMPVDVKFDLGTGKTLVKGMVYKNYPPSDRFWQTTQAQPPMRWFPSIGGSTISKAVREENGRKYGIITQLRWSNVGLTQEPINQSVSPISVLPFGAFLKSFDAGIRIDQAMGSPEAAPLIKEDLEGAATDPEKRLLDEYLSRKDQLVSELMSNYGYSKETAKRLVAIAYGKKLQTITI